MAVGVAVGAGVTAGLEQDSEELTGSHPLLRHIAPLTALYRR
jgi:hypothetical protein